jgi:hypothetical protein
VQQGQGLASWCLAVLRHESSRSLSSSSYEVRMWRISSRFAAFPEPQGASGKSMAEKREAERRRRPRGPARPAWQGESRMAGSPVPRWAPRGPLAKRRSPMRALACAGSEVPCPSQGTTGGQEPSARHARATLPHATTYSRSQVRDGLRGTPPMATELPS